MWPALIIVIGSALQEASPAGDGVIEGTVLRAADNTPVSGAEVVLRAKGDGQLLPVAETTTDADGRFRFAQLPANDDYLYLPGANRGGIHYPGPPVKLNSLRRAAEVKLAVYDSAAFPNPLTVRRHTIELSPQPGLLRVTESMLIENPSQMCYVGQSASADSQPVTLQLSIPADFQQVTFGGEFFGRRFHLIDGKLVTSVPWPPGQRELTFSYLLASSGRHCVWQRALDLPSSNLRVLVHSDRPDQVRSNLHAVLPAEGGQIAFASDERVLAVGHVLRVELGALPVSVMTYAPWAALATLGGLILATSVKRRRG